MVDHPSRKDWNVHWASGQAADRNRDGFTGSRFDGTSFFLARVCCLRPFRRRFAIACIAGRLNWISGGSMVDQGYDG